MSIPFLLVGTLIHFARNVSLQSVSCFSLNPKYNHQSLGYFYNTSILIGNEKNIKYIEELPYTIACYPQQAKICNRRVLWHQMIARPNAPYL